MIKRRIRIMSLILALLMVMPFVLMACGSESKTTDKKSETTDAKTDETTASTTTEDTSLGGTTYQPGTTIKEPETTEVPETDAPVNPAYAEWKAWEKEANMINLGINITSKIAQQYKGSDIKYYINETYSADKSAYRAITTSTVATYNKHFVVWDIDVQEPTDPEGKAQVSVYVSELQLNLATEFSRYSTMRDKDFVVSFKTNAPYTVYARIVTNPNANLNIADNTPFVAMQIKGNNGEVSGRLKVKYTDLTPGTNYYVNFYLRAQGAELKPIASVPLTITENKNYKPNQFKIYFLNIDGYSNFSTIDRVEKRFYEFYPTLYYAYTELAGGTRGRFKTVYVRITKGTSNDPKTGGDDAIAYVSSPPDTFYWDATWAARVDDVDCMVHELTHVLQNSCFSSSNGFPGFFTEGIAEYSRYVYGGDSKSTWSPPNDKTNEFQAYNAGGFFVYICKTYNSYLRQKTGNDKADIMVEIFRIGKTSSWRHTTVGDKISSWKELTGKEYNELVAEYRASSFTMPTDYNNPNGQYAQFVKDLRVQLPDGYVFK